MKKLSFVLALAIVLASNAFADKSHHKGNGRKQIEYSKEECDKYEVKDDGFLYKDGKKIIPQSGQGSISDMLNSDIGVFYSCKEYGVKGEHHKNRSDKKQN
jgi:hypothetical protein